MPKLKTEQMAVKKRETRSNVSDFFSQFRPISIYMAKVNSISSNNKRSTLAKRPLNLDQDV